ncbi:RNase H family protein [Micromonospora sp. 4G57]|uniref:RNase H family protein n=1 Tax=Micromonospora sicca TaxID=2202420 RepID=A0ABU5J692_9ACTN|nr:MULTISPECIES: RNase H family protein [unclassified Micromonospora]MDZ5443409.1 RNase H family protein [Micromonospora sp. 4G57]MDZ5488091.1 RNase H family protein [Micromonospora sp. 4G53]
MRSDEFLRALDLLPAPLHDRALALRGYVRLRRCETCQAVGDAVRLALTAVHYDELASATQLLDTAEQLATPHNLACRPEHQPGRGQVRRWAATSAPLIAATDASWKGRAGGIGYVASDGRYGLRSRRPGRVDPTGFSRVLVSELRAVEFLLTAYDTPPVGMTVLVDSLPALRYLHRWQGGETGAMPASYDLRPRRAGMKPTLVRLAELVARRPDLRFAHVKAHAHHALNEAADSLAHMARRRVEEPFDVRPRAHDLAEAFLRDWHVAQAA